MLFVTVPLDLASPHASIYLSAQQAGSQSQKEPVPGRTCSHPRCPRMEGGHRHGLSACPSAAPTQVPASGFPTSLYPSESPGNHRMGLISWPLSQLGVSGVDTAGNGIRDGERC